jgi:hypothetical protein
MLRELCHGLGSRLPPFTRGDPVLIKGQSVWDLWWTKWHWNQCIDEWVGFTLSVSLCQCIKLIFICTLLLSKDDECCPRNWKHWKEKYFHWISYFRALVFDDSTHYFNLENSLTDVTAIKHYTTWWDLCPYWYLITPCQVIVKKQNLIKEYKIFITVILG